MRALSIKKYGSCFDILYPLLIVTYTTGMPQLKLSMALQDVTGLFALLFILQCWPLCNVHISSFSCDADSGAPFRY